MRVEVRIFGLGNCDGGGIISATRRGIGSNVFGGASGGGSGLG